MALKKENVEKLLDKKFVKVYDMQYAPGKHYFNATRRDIDDLVGLKSDDEFKEMLPDAVSCVVIVRGREDKLLLTYEHRYTTSRFLLSVPAGLIDDDDKETDNPLISSTIREMYEETGVRVKRENCEVLNWCLFSSPGLTDESNGIVKVEIDETDLKDLSFENVQGGEEFDGFVLLTKDEAQRILRDGRDDRGNFYSVYVAYALQYFAGR